MKKIRCAKGGRCRFDKNGICVKCGYDKVYHRIRKVYLVMYSLVFSVLALVSGKDLAIIFPDSFLSAIVESLLSANVVLGFIGMYFTFFVLLVIISPLYLFPFYISRRKCRDFCSVVMFVDLFAGFTVAGWLVALVMAIIDSHRHAVERSAGDAS